MNLVVNLRGRGEDKEEECVCGRVGWQKIAGCVTTLVFSLASSLWHVFDSVLNPGGETTEQAATAHTHTSVNFTANRSWVLWMCVIRT